MNFLISLLVMFNMNVNEEVPLKNEEKDIVEKVPMTRSSFLGYKDIDELHINSLEQWNEFALNSKNLANGVVYLDCDLDFNNKDIIPVTLNANVKLEGKGKKFINIKTNKIMFIKNEGEINNLIFENVLLDSKDSIYLIDYNKGSISNCTFNNFKINNININNMAGILGRNYGYFLKNNFSGIEINSGSNVGLVSKNYGSIDSVTAKRVTISGYEFLGGVVGASTSRVKTRNLSIPTKISNVNLDTINIYSRLYLNKKTYRNNSKNETVNKYVADKFGGVAGKNSNSIVDNVKINNVTIIGDSVLGGVVGWNLYNDDKDTNSFQTTILNNAKVSNVKIYSGIRSGGVVGYSVDYRTEKLGYYAKDKMKAQVNNVHVSGNFMIDSISESGGIVGLNYYSKLTNSSAKANYRKYHIVTSFDEAGGAMGDNEFGYVSKVNTYLNVYAKQLQAGGFVGDNEGVIEHSKAYGRVYSNRESGGFVGNNLGKINYSYAYGNVYTQRYVTVKKKVKVKVKVRVKKRGKKKYRYKYKYVWRRYKLPFYSGNFVGLNKNERYKGFNLRGDCTKSNYKNYRYLNNKKMKNLKYGAYGK